MKRKELHLILLLLFLLLFPSQWAMAQTDTGNDKKADQAVIITGVISDAEGEPLPGVTIRNIKNKRTALTNVNGEFSIPGAKGETLAISYIGKKPMQVKASTGRRMKITMEDDAESISEVVVTGIYSRNKESFTGSASSFSAEELKMAGNTNLIQSLKTLDPAFTVLENNQFGSDPNRLPDLEIRGKSSIVGLKEQFGQDPNQPLFILDGFETTLQTIMDLSMDRIASVNILKDAASTAIYGSKAANGVIVVETKAPEMGKLKLTYNGSFNYSWADLTDYNLMNASEKLEFERLAGNFESYTADGEERARIRYNMLLGNVQRGVDTYWLSEPLQKGLNQRHNLYVQGGSDELRFGIGVNYNRIDGVMKDSKRDVGGGYLDITYRTGKLRFTNKMTVDFTDLTNPVVSFSDYAGANPYYPKRNDDGSIDQWLEAPKTGVNVTSASPYVSNPLWNAAQNSYNKGNSWSVRNSLNLEYRPIEEVMIRGRVSVSKSTNETEEFLSPSDTRFNQEELLKKGSYSNQRSDGFDYDGDLSVTFGKLFARKHQVNAVVGASIRESKGKDKGFTAQGFPEGNFTTPGFANRYPEGGKPSYSDYTSRSANFYFNGGYAFMNKYLLDANIRMDGTSVFGSNKHFTTTWAFGVGWNLAYEDFIRNHTGIFNMLKIRGSIGNPGNQSFGAFNAITTYKYNNWMLNNFGTGVLIDAFGDPNLEWQKTIDLNAGIDVSMWNRFHLNFDIYRKNTDPLLAQIGIPLSVGTAQRLANIGQQINEGYSGTVRYAILYNPKKSLNWTISLSFAHNTSEYRKIGNRLNQFNNENISKSLTRYYDGGSPTAIWAVRSAGIDPATGKEVFITKDNTYTFQHSYDQEVVVGDTRPDLEGVIGNTLYWKGFSASIYCRYSLGGHMFNSTLYNKVENISTTALQSNQDKRALYDRWQKPGDIAQFRGIRETDVTPMSSRFVQKNDYFTIESVRLGWELPTRWMDTIGFQGISLSAYMNEIARWSTIKDERGTSYPFARSVSLAVGINF
ncbi:SusC/RagA family TonB-linked outer membrane protein [Duncaniella freteri]|jgi:TonB-linked SusC/RagA family outer membrane protein|uniref:SusC/RagA family TonB-linked outer membrane protein n=41 Tax=Duncaniella TaxID=2518495 RepID=A0A4Z0V8U7_9BACT|nr:SusC/RagA family TonB-linked outer membrane protein [Duncaniella freteri]TGG39808.1 SusC/RagA family TonB-linked outer membrane protein [Duncaniella freteri]